MRVKLGMVVRGLILGLAAMLIATVVYWAGLSEPVELQTLDLRFRKLPTITARDDVVHLDLDDKSLDQIGRWPWPRRRLGKLIEVLNECGASSVVLDILLPQPQQPRFVKQGYSDLYMADAATLLNPDAPPVPVLDDVQFARTLAASPNLFLAMHVDIPGRPGRRAQDGLRERLAAIIATRPAIDQKEAAARAGAEPPAVSKVISSARQDAFERRIRRILRDKPGCSLEEVLKMLLGEVVPGSGNFDIARRAYLRQRGLGALRRFALPESTVLSGTIPAGRAVPPLVTIAQEMAHTGFVTVTPDADGVVRRIPLLVKTDVGVFPQLALRLAADSLSAGHGGKYTISAESGKVSITCPDGFVREIPTDSNGYMLINWSRDIPGRRSARHISAVAAAEVWQGRDAIRHNENLSRLACLEIARLLDNRAVLDIFAADDRIWKELYTARRNRQAARLFRPANVPPAPEGLVLRQGRLEGRIELACRKMIEEVDSFYLAGDLAGDTQTAPAAQIGPAAQTAPADPADNQLLRLRSLRNLVERTRIENAGLRRRLADSIARLRKEVGGKICLVGSTATGAADFVPTPVHRRTPGVVVHANILNTILSGKFVRVRRGWFSVALILLAGTLVALVTSIRGPIESAILLAVAIIGYAVIDAAVWSAWTYWIIVAAPIGTMLLVFTTITVYRQLTEQRQRRQITSTFKRYLSPAMVDELIVDPSQASLGGQKRHLSCLFSDLAGFTSLAERLGPEGTVGLLNRYLDRVGEILQVRYGGTLSKYEGDGLFAFFGAPIPQDDHARRAILSALDCQAFLPQFNRRLRDEGSLPDGLQLTSRIGITSGEVFVGNMGSTQRIAYTAIGDSVNLASRLEVANKFFGTSILVNASSWLAARDDLVGRPLGKIVVVGKTEAVEVWEPLARRDHADESLERFAEEFAAGVDLYAAGDFQAARDRFGSILAERDDPPAGLYLRLCDQAEKQPDFDGVIRLTEK